jgi:hypothetical protein
LSTVTDTITDLPSNTLRATFNFGKAIAGIFGSGTEKIKDTVIESKNIATNIFTEITSDGGSSIVGFNVVNAASAMIDEIKDIAEFDEENSECIKFAKTVKNKLKPAVILSSLFSNFKDGVNTIDDIACDCITFVKDNAHKAKPGVILSSLVDEVKDIAEFDKENSVVIKFAKTGANKL